MQTLESIYQLLSAGDVALAIFETGGWQLLQVHRKVSVDVDGRSHELSAAAHNACVDLQLKEGVIHWTSLKQIPNHAMRGFSD